jgi:hypothetical protein
MWQRYQQLLQAIDTYHGAPLVYAQLSMIEEVDEDDELHDAITANADTYPYYGCGIKVYTSDSEDWTLEDVRADLLAKIEAVSHAPLPPVPDATQSIAPTAEDIEVVKDSRSTAGPLTAVVVRFRMEAHLGGVDERWLDAIKTHLHTYNETIWDEFRNNGRPTIGRFSFTTTDPTVDSDQVATVTARHSISAALVATHVPLTNV